jgi:hypothetical protein
MKTVRAFRPPIGGAITDVGDPIVHGLCFVNHAGLPSKIGRRRSIFDFDQMALVESISR